jgi:hypothetical protein
MPKPLRRCRNWNCRRALPPTARSDARYCSPACRAQARRTEARDLVATKVRGAYDSPERRRWRALWPAGRSADDVGLPPRGCPLLFRALPRCRLSRPPPWSRHVTISSGCRARRKPNTKKAADGWHADHQSDQARPGAGKEEAMMYRAFSELIVNMTKTATTKKSWRKHPWWRRKPLPDCPVPRQGPCPDAPL